MGTTCFKQNISNVENEKQKDDYEPELEPCIENVVAEIKHAHHIPLVDQARLLDQSVRIHNAVEVLETIQVKLINMEKIIDDQIKMTSPVLKHKKLKIDIHEWPLVKEVYHIKKYDD